MSLTDSPGEHAAQRVGREASLSLEVLPPNNAPWASAARDPKYPRLVWYDSQGPQLWCSARGPLFMECVMNNDENNVAPTARPLFGIGDSSMPYSERQADERLLRERFGFNRAARRRAAAVERVLSPKERIARGGGVFNG